MASSEQPPEAGIFFTPENEAFYSHRKYKWLDPRKRDIRLLRVHPKRLRLREVCSVSPRWLDRVSDVAQTLERSDGTEASYICCELEDEVPLESASGKYTALSYCAGRATDTARIIINEF
jgi:hypothetical protein